MLTYETINLDEYVRTGEGGTAVSYTHKTRNTLAKLYNPGFEAERAKAEFLTARTVYELGVPTPEPYRLVTDGERFAAKVPYVFDMAYHTSLPEASFPMIMPMFSV